MYSNHTLQSDSGLCNHALKPINTHGKWNGLMLLIVFAAVSLCVQSASKERATGETLKLANAAYLQLHYSAAARLFEQCPNSGLSPKELTALADCYWQERNYTQCLAIYKQLAAAEKSQLTETDKFRIGELYARQGQYAEAAKWLEGIPGYAAKANAYSTLQPASSLTIDSLIWRVGFLNVNTGYREYAPTLAGDKLLFSSNRPVKSKQKTFAWDGKFYSRLWQVSTEKLKVIPASSVSASVASGQNKLNTNMKTYAKIFEGSDVKPSSNTISKYLPEAYIHTYDSLPGSVIAGFDYLKYNAGGIALDNNKTIYFSSNYPKANKNGDNKLRLMQGSFNGIAVENSVALPFGDNSYSVMHPAVTPDGKILVFSSDKPGGSGGFDLFYSIRQNNSDTWGAPVPFSSAINSAGNEVFPSITKDGDLFYSSDAQIGLGGLDIYKVKLSDAIAGKGIPEHLPYPVNTAQDDFGWTQEDNGKTAYFTSDRNSGEDNIYVASYDEEGAHIAALAKLPRSIEGFVLDRQSMSPISGAFVFLWNKCDNKVYVAKTDEKGRYTYPLLKSCEIQLLGTARDYTKDCLSMQAVLDLKAENTVQKATHDLLIERESQELNIVLPTIHYDFDKWNIRADARPILDSVVTILKSNSIKVELGSHTDSRGSLEYNDRLSEKRAKAAVEYIVKKGIAASRITAKGYGERQLLNNCADGVHCSEAAHQANRRTEIKTIRDKQPTTPAAFDPSQFKAGQVVDPSQLPEGFFGNCK